MKRLERLWRELYGKTDKLFDNLMEHLRREKEEYSNDFPTVKRDWYKESVIYSLYVDLFNRNVDGLVDKLPHLEKLGVNCLWLLPVLESPMKDAGFDISNYRSIRPDILNLPEDSTQAERNEKFAQFLKKAHERGIRVIFDIALNHCSDEHPWFLEAKQSRDNPKRNFFIWSDTDQKYSEARIIFKGLSKSNWEWEPETGQYFFHRFFDIQPDLNYKNPEVLAEMTKVLIFWKTKGLDGFRADAIPYLWKEEGTDCENLEKTHTIVKFFRAALDYMEEGTLLLAEACQPPKKVVEYFGDNDECNAAYHFPVMPRIYRSLAEESNEAVKMALSPSFTPSDIPPDCQWLMFLRCHDELTLEMVTPQEREFIFNYYAKDPKWNFREGEGIAARLSDLFDNDLNRIKLAYSIEFSLLGTPIIYYGDEFGKRNDEAYYREMIEKTGIKDSRYLNRGRIDWESVEQELGNENSQASKLYHFLSQLNAVRKEHPVLGRGRLEFMTIQDDEGNEIKEILAYKRVAGDDCVTVFQNLSNREISFKEPALAGRETDIPGNTIEKKEDRVVLAPYHFYWV